MADASSANTRPVFATALERPTDGWHDNRGNLSWTTLFSAGQTPTDTFTAGVAVVEPGGFLALHRHAPAEIYFVLEGTGRITIDGAIREIASGTAVFIPGNAEHGIRNDGTATLRFLYAFATNAFEDVTYIFSQPLANAPE